MNTREGPTPPRRSGLPIPVVVVAWGLLSSIPLAMVIGVVLILLQQAGQRNFRPGDIGVLVFMAGPLILVLACGWIVASRAGRAVSLARFGVACGRCGYDMRAVPATTCPECGLIAARTTMVPLRSRISWSTVVHFILPAVSGAAGLIALVMRMR